MLDDINNEYQIFVEQKLIQLKMVKEFSQKITKSIEDFQLPILDKLLSSKYGFLSSKCVCEKCGYVAKNQHALSCHKRGSCGKQVEPIPSLNIQLQTPVQQPPQQLLQTPVQQSLQKPPQTPPQQLLQTPLQQPPQQKPTKIITKTIVTSQNK